MSSEYNFPVHSRKCSVEAVILGFYILQTLIALLIYLNIDK